MGSWEAAVIFMPRSEGSRNWEKSIPGRRSNMHKGPEALKDSSCDWGKEKRRKEMRWRMRPGRQAGTYWSG